MGGLRRSVAAGVMQCRRADIRAKEPGQADFSGNAANPFVKVILYVKHSLAVYATKKTSSRQGVAQPLMAVAPCRLPKKARRGQSFHGSFFAPLRLCVMLLFFFQTASEIPHARPARGMQRYAVV